jgi:hypothetical protein
MRKEDYKPSFIEFDVNPITELIPLSLGKFKSLQEAADFLHTQVNGLNQKVTTNRFIDNFEKSEIRKEYNDLLENKIPILERELMKIQNAYSEMKKELDNAKESVSATINEAKSLAYDVKRGIREITVDDIATWRVPFDGLFYYYTFIDGEIRLCKTSIIPESEKMELYNSTEKNEVFFNSLKEVNE